MSLLEANLKGIIAGVHWIPKIVLLQERGQVR